MTGAGADLLRACRHLLGADLFVAGWNPLRDRIEVLGADAQFGVGSLLGDGRANTVGHATESGHGDRFVVDRIQQVNHFGDQ